VPACPSGKGGEVWQGEKLSRVLLHSIRIVNFDINLGRAAFGEILILTCRERDRKDSKRVEANIKFWGRSERHFISGVGGERASYS
jgi:hypothetical protein